MNTWLNRALVTAATTLMASVDRVRPMPLKKPVSAQAARPAGPPTMPREPVLVGERRDVRRETKEADERPPGERQRDVDRHGERRRPDAGARRRSCPRVRPGAVRLRDDGLHAHRHAAQQQVGDDHRPEHRRHPGERRRGDPPEEPGVGQVQHRLQAAVDEQRERERRHRAEVDVGVARGVVPLRREPRHRARVRRHVVAKLQTTRPRLGGGAGRASRILPAGGARGGTAPDGVLHAASCGLSFSCPERSLLSALR